MGFFSGSVRPENSADQDLDTRSIMDLFQSFGNDSLWLHCFKMLIIPC